MLQRIHRLLVANRGEIAMRVMRAASELSIPTVAIYSQEDRFSLHRTKADEAYLVGEGKGAIDAYLDIAGHPARGARGRCRCDPSGLWLPVRESRVRRAVLPRRASSSSARARKPCACWATRWPRATWRGRRRCRDAGDARRCRTSWSECRRLAGQVGYPVMLKASWGGGGRGMRVIESDAQLAELLPVARREARAAFGNDEVYLEKLVRRARHLEVQILGDSHGNLVHLFERDCTVQRRNQKVVERAPAVFLSDEERAELCAAALSIGRAAHYHNAGTVEFLQDAGSGSVLLHRGQPAHPGRAHGDRMRHRHRSGQGADPYCRRRAHRRPGQRRPAAGADPH